MALLVLPARWSPCREEMPGSGRSGGVEHHSVDEGHHRLRGPQLAVERPARRWAKGGGEQDRAGMRGSAASPGHCRAGFSALELAASACADEAGHEGRRGAERDEYIRPRRWPAGPPPRRCAARTRPRTLVEARSLVGATRSPADLRGCEPGVDRLVRPCRSARVRGRARRAPDFSPLLTGVVDRWGTHTAVPRRRQPRRPGADLFAGPRLARVHGSVQSGAVRARGRRPADYRRGPAVRPSARVRITPKCVLEWCLFVRGSSVSLRRHPPPDTLETL